MCLDNGLFTVAGKGSAMVVQRHADPLAAAGRILPGLAPVVRLAADHLQHLGQLDLLNDVAVGSGLVALLGDVLHLQLQRIHAQMVGNVIQMGFHRKDRLRCAEAAESVGGEHIGRHTLALQIGAGECVNTVAVEHAALQHNVGRGQVRAAVIVNMALDAGDFAVLDRRLVDALGGMTLDGELGVLLTVKDHLDRLADDILSHQQRTAKRVGEMLLTAERAAGGGLTNDDILRRNVQQPGYRLTDVERALRRSIEDKLSVLHVHDRAVRLQMYMLLIGRFDRLLEDLVRLGKHLVHGTALLAEQLAHHIAVLLREERTAYAVDGIINGDGRRHFLIVDFDLRLQVLEHGTVRTDHQADGLAVVQNIFIREAAPILHNHPQLVFALGGNVLC